MAKYYNEYEVGQKVGLIEREKYTLSEPIIKTGVVSYKGTTILKVKLDNVNGMNYELTFKKGSCVSSDLLNSYKLFKNIEEASSEIENENLKEDLINDITKSLKNLSISQLQSILEIINM